MGGLPAGAAQSFSVPAELRSYDHVTSIEFIQIDPNLPCPLSAAYRPTSGGAEMLIRRETPDLHKLALTEEEARSLIKGLDEAGLFEWNRVYCPAQGNFRVTATEWRLAVEFDRKPAKHEDAFQSEGENEFPDGYDAVVSLLVHERIESFEISE